MKRSKGWTVLSVVLVVLVGVLVPLSVVAVWTKAELLDTDRYVASVAPLATDPKVQEQVIARVSEAVSKSVDMQKLRADEPPVPALVGPITAQVDQLIERVVRRSGRVRSVRDAVEGRQPVRAHPDLLAAARRRDERPRGGPAHLGPDADGRAGAYQTGEPRDCTVRQCADQQGCEPVRAVRRRNHWSGPRCGGLVGAVRSRAGDRHTRVRSRLGSRRA